MVIWYRDQVIIRLKARLQPNIKITLQHILAVFTHSAITLGTLSQAGPSRFWTWSA